METRIAALERSVRRWRLVSLAAIVLGAGGLLPMLSPGIFREVRASRFSVVNVKGEEVAALGLDEQHEPQLFFRLQRSKATVVVGSLAGDIAGVGIVGKTAQLSMAADSDGLPAFSIHADKAKATLGVSRKGEPILLMLDGTTNLSATPATLRFRASQRDVLVLPAAEGSERK